MRSCILIALIIVSLFGISSQSRRRPKVKFADVSKDNPQLVTYNAKFSCSVKMPQWCFKLKIFEDDSLSDDWIADHPYICTSKNTSGISLQAFFDDEIEQNDWLEPYAHVMHNCNKQRKLHWYYLTLPALYRVNNAFSSHSIDLQLDGLGEPVTGIHEFPAWNNYDDSPFLNKLQLFLKATNNSTTSSTNDSTNDLTTSSTKDLTTTSTNDVMTTSTNDSTNDSTTTSTITSTTTSTMVLTTTSTTTSTTNSTNDSTDDSTTPLTIISINDPTTDLINNSTTNSTN